MAKHLVGVLGKNVEVETVLEKEGRFFLLTAECDGTVLEHTMTIGPSEGAGPEHYDQAMLQRDLDAAREKVAAEAEWHARVRKMMDLAT